MPSSIGMPGCSRAASGLVDVRAAAVGIVDQVIRLRGRLVHELAALAEEFAGGGDESVRQPVIEISGCLGADVVGLAGVALAPAPCNSP